MLSRHQRRVLMALGALVTGFMIGMLIMLTLTVPPVPSPQPTPTPIVQKSPTPAVCTGPLIPYGALPKGTRYSTLADQKEHPFVMWLRVQYLKVPGKNGRLWGVSVGKRVLLYAPQSQYCERRGI